MLEDELEDILGKAIRGQGKSHQELGLDTLSAPSLEHLELLAKNLELSFPALAGLDQPFSTTTLPLEVNMFTAPFGHLGVNCFSVKHQEKTYLIDTGTDPNLICDLQVDTLLITHAHPDHDACAPILDCPQISAKNAKRVHKLGIQSFDVSGHFSPSAAYYFPDLETPVCFVGDSLFRRSMGGCNSPKTYRTAIRNVKSMLADLPNETILCVGHGPNTTVAEELEQNPFFAH